MKFAHTTDPEQIERNRAAENEWYERNRAHAQALQAYPGFSKSPGPQRWPRRSMKDWARSLSRRRGIRGGLGIAALHQMKGKADKGSKFWKKSLARTVGKEAANERLKKKKKQSPWARMASSVGAMGIRRG